MSALTLATLAARELAARLAGPGLGIRTGPFALRLRTDATQVLQGIRLLYGAYPVVDDDSFCDFALDLTRARGLRRWMRPQILATYDGAPIFEPLPLGHAFPLFEWTFNWCITTHAFEHLSLHAAVVERHGRP